MQTLRFAILLSLAGCAGAPERPTDDFVRAAESWEGQSAQAMIRRWGPPDTIDDQKATWRLGWRSVRCVDSTRRQAPFGGFMSYTRRECSPVSMPHKCVVTANFDAMREVTEVRALSYRCAQVYQNYVRMLDSGYPYNLYKYSNPGDSSYSDKSPTVRY